MLVGMLPSVPVADVAPVCVYALVLATMMHRAYDRSAAAVGRSSWVLCFVGALLFVLSDSVLAWDRFVHPVAAARVIVMTTYYAGQLLIALSTVSGAASKRHAE